MRTIDRSTMKKQVVRLKDAENRDGARKVALARAASEETDFRQGRDWFRHQICRHDTFSMFTLEEYRHSSEDLGCSLQGDYVKINFWLRGKHTTILDSYGQYDHDCPEVFMTSGPRDMIKMDLLNRDTQLAFVALCLLPEFFPRLLGVALDELPEPLRTIMTCAERPFGFHRFRLTPDMAVAARAILAAPFAVRRQLAYTQAKAVELMCLFINSLQEDSGEAQPNKRILARHEPRLHAAREFLTRYYAEEVTLERIAREIGLNRMTLTSGFRELFGLSVHDYLQKIRMERAFALLQEDAAASITRVAAAVGYSHHCNFSTAFHAYFGCPPQRVRGGRR